MVRKWMTEMMMLEHVKVRRIEIDVVVDIDDDVVCCCYHYY